jgi:hypothetical protein
VQRRKIKPEFWRSKKPSDQSALGLPTAKIGVIVNPATGEWLSISQLKVEGISMADYAADIAKYTSKVNATAVETIVKFCGIALKGKDSQWVSVTDPAEVKRVVDGFCAKKLGLDAGKAEAAVKAVGEKMKADKTKHRVTVYYLVAEHTGTLAKIS